MLKQEILGWSISKHIMLCLYQKRSHTPVVFCYSSSIIFIIWMLYCFIFQGVFCSFKAIPLSLLNKTQLFEGFLKSSLWKRYLWSSLLLVNFLLIINFLTISNQSINPNLIEELSFLSVTYHFWIFPLYLEFKILWWLIVFLFRFLLYKSKLFQ